MTWGAACSLPNLVERPSDEWPQPFGLNTGAQTVNGELNDVVIALADEIQRSEHVRGQKRTERLRGEQCGTARKIDELHRYLIPPFSLKCQPKVRALLAVAVGHHPVERNRRKRPPNPILNLVSPQNPVRYIEINP